MLISLHSMGKLRLERGPELLSNRTRMILVLLRLKPICFSSFLGAIYHILNDANSPVFISLL